MIFVVHVIFDIYKEVCNDLMLAYRIIVTQVKFYASFLCI